MSEKNPTAVQIGQRIKQARKMAGLDTALQLLEKIPSWGSGRLGNYEAGISIPSPDDVREIAKITGASPCWIMFGVGPIRSSGRDTQAIRHQNLMFLADDCRATDSTFTLFLKSCGLSHNKLDQHISDPFLNISDRLARRCEKFANKTKGWMDEQHVESDPVCAAFPLDMRQVMEVFSNLDTTQRKLFVNIALAFDENTQKQKN